MNKTFYFHVNNHNQPKREMGILSRRQQRKQQKHSYTVAGVFDGEVMKFGISKCSPNDQFNKRKGRIVAEGRAKSKHDYIHLIEIQPEADLSKLFITEAMNLVNNF